MSADLPLAARPPRARRTRDLLVMGGLLVLFAAGFAGLAAATGWRETWAQIRAITPGQIAILLVLSLANYGLRAVRWHLFSRRLGFGLTLGADARHFLGGFAMTVTPARMGELVRMRWLAREAGRPVEAAAPLILMDRAADLAAMAILLGAGVALASGSGLAGAPLAVALALAAAILATRPRLLEGMVNLGYRLIRRLPRPFARIRAAVRTMERFDDPRVLVPALALGLAGWFAECYAFHLLLVWLNADIGLWHAVAIFVFGALAGGITGAPGGVGGAEAAMIALLLAANVPLDAAVAATAVIRVTTLWFALVLGLAIFPFAERLSLKARDALENR
ncbi:MAG: YbhN family protein [Paracoccaceae bacterium]